MVFKHFNLVYLLKQIVELFSRYTYRFCSIWYQYVGCEVIYIRQPAQFVLVGSGKPEMGELRPQLFDRFEARAGNF